MFTNSFVSFFMCLLAFFSVDARTLGKASNDVKSSEHHQRAMQYYAKAGQLLSAFSESYSSYGFPQNSSPQPSNTRHSSGGKTYIKVPFGSNSSSYSSPKSITTPNSGQSGGTSSSNSSGSVAGSDSAKWLAAHNKARAQYGAPALTWSTTLEAFAQKFTEACVFEHTKNNKYGENLAAGQQDIESVVNDWVSGPNEKDVYDPASPVYSHFTQVVWSGSTELGCAVKSCTNVAGLPQSPAPLYVCEYNPPGNVEGQYAENVKASKGGASLSA
ncbi:secreted protein [Melampsora americana]|nr:secreted protein [Melampsora americana]